jgi:hypothetical protein
MEATQKVFEDDRAARDDTATFSADDRTQETIDFETAVQTGPWALEIGGSHGVRSVLLEPGHCLKVGSARSVDVRIHDRSVSGRHCVIRADSYGVRVEDAGSKNGVYVGGARVSSATLLAPLSSFVIGRTTITIRCVAAVDLGGSDQPVPGLIGDSAPMRRVAREVRRYAKMRGPVLLQGESGTGKDVVARCLHHLSGRQGTYVPLNAGALPETLADAELFGHCRGAFTGAVASRQGAFQQADRGTLFLDEIAELIPAIQVKLLRVVEDGCVRPVGGTRPVQVDVRVVAATWAPLAQRVEEGRFREDLYHRLTLGVIELPPLRHRRSDIPALSHMWLTRLCDELGPKRLSSSALARLVAHCWPGNVRELAGVLYRAALASDGVLIAAEHVQVGMLEPRRSQSKVRPLDARKLLEQHSGNISAASRAAGVARSTFRAWLERSERSPSK